MVRKTKNLVAKRRTAQRPNCLWIALCVSVSLPLATVDAQDSLQKAKDARVVQTLLRLKSIDVNSRPDLKQAVLRHLEQFKGTAKYTDLVRQLKLKGVESELLQMALADPTGNVGVNAADLLLEREVTKPFDEVLAEADGPRAVSAAKVLGLSSSPLAGKLLQPLIADQQIARPVRSAAAAALGRSRQGQRFLLELVENGNLPQDLNFIAANALYGSPDAKIRQRVAKHLTLPATAGAKPLPPISELVKLRGNEQKGRELFKNKATCANCHKVAGEGKEVGPDLSEIGSKLTREAFFVSILDPSAGISHNYETYNAILDSGNILSGILVSRTDDAVTLRTAEAIDKKIATDDIEEIVKSSVSLMPADLQKILTVDELVDVVEYLTTLKKEAVR